MLEVQNLTYSIGSKTLLDSVKAQVVPGELLVVLGPNGAGKSTLLKILAGEIAPLNHQVLLNDHFLTHYSSRELAKIRAVMPQFVSLDFAFLVEEIVGMGVFCASKIQVEQKVMAALELFDVSHLKNRDYLSLSGGEQQRVQLARVVAQILPSATTGLSSNPNGFSPRYLLLDECTSSLDLSHQQIVFKVLKKLAKDYGMGVVTVLHDLNLASQFADQALLLMKGQVYAAGAINTVLQPETLSYVYEHPIKLILQMNTWPLVVPI